MWGGWWRENSRTQAPNDHLYMNNNNNIVIEQQQQQQQNNFSATQFICN